MSTLPTPTLDDRRFQDLVDDAKRLVQRRCPEWSDHNVSDQGVTLIEAFAWMTDQLLYRLNRVPDRLYVKFLELIGVRLFPPSAARCPVTFWLSAPQASVVTIPAETEVATVRTESDAAIVFSTVDPLHIVPCSLIAAVSMTADDRAADHTAELGTDAGFFCFEAVPRTGDALLVGLSEAVPSCTVTLRLDCRLEGIGVDPDRPPIRWEASTGDGWARCVVDSDGTGGFNRDGETVLHVPAAHRTSILAGRRAGWLRARVVDAGDGTPGYRASPRILQIRSSTIGGTVEALNAAAIVGELLGSSHGVAGQRFPLQQRPVVATEEAPVLEVSADEGWEEWTHVDGFAESGPEDRHFLLDPVTGEVCLGPEVREPDGTLRRFGAVPPKGAVLRLRRYRTGGGRQGNVARAALCVLKSSIPYVDRVENRAAAHGGVDGEDIENAKRRGPMALHSRSRAVTLDDYVELAREAAPEVARVRCVPAGDGAAGGVRVLVVPAVQQEDGGRLRLEQLVPAESTLASIAAHLEQRRTIGARVTIQPPVYQGITVVARLRPRSRTIPQQVQAAALEALDRWFHPLRGGPDGSGWPFGRPAHIGDVYSVLQRVRGVEYIEDARLFAADPITGQRGTATQRIVLDPHALVFSYDHQVVVEGA